MIKLRVLIVCVTAPLVFAACGGVSSNSATGTVATAAPATTDSLLPDSAVKQIEQLIKEKEARTPAQRKVSSQLLYAKQQRLPGSVLSKPGATKDPTQIQSLLQTDSEGRVLVDVHGDLGGGLERKIDEAKGVLVASSSIHHSVRAWMPLENLESLADQPVVQAIRPALRARLRRADPPGGNPKFHLTREQQLANVQTYLKEYAATHPLSASVKRAQPAAADTNAVATTFAGAVTSEGDVAMSAAQARKFYGVDGTGVTIGVLSDSEDFLAQAIASGDLPADTVVLPGQSGEPGTGEGTAMMEIIHDLAPGAKLLFATAFNSPESFAQNIVDMRFTYHADIIVDDVGYFAESPYQDDIIALAVNQITADGGMYFSAAGNDGNFDDGTSGLWEGDFKSAGALATLPSGYTVHDFGSKVISNRVEVAGEPIYLHWSDASTLDNATSSNDYDLFVLDEDLRNVLAAGTDIQDGVNSIPFEFIEATIPVNSRIVIAKKAAAQVRAVRLQLSGGELALTTPGSTYGHAAAASAMGVGAVDAAEAVGGVFAAGPTTQAELYSSDGPRRMFYNPDGTVIRNGMTFSGSGGKTFQKPDFAAADGVSTTLPGTSGLNPFFGTSAAAPHAAAIAGLIKSAVPTMTQESIGNAMANSALDIEAKGDDRDTGSGIVFAMSALKKAGAKPVAFIELGTVTVASGTSNVLFPGGTASITTQLINNGGATASNVKGVLSTSNPLVTIAQGTASYGNLLAGGTATNAVPYQISVNSAIACGSKINFQESVSFSGRGTNPTVLSFTQPTGAVSTTQIVTNYTGGRVAIPDGNAAGVDIPITLTNIGMISKVNFHIQGATCTATQGATTVGVDHSWVGDLSMTLKSPSGTVVALMTRPGGINNSGNNFCKTILDDSATNSIQNIAIAGAPWQGSFKPASPLSAFAGEIADGVWTLHVTDSVTVDTGSVREFSIDTNGFTCTP